MIPDLIDILLSIEYETVTLFDGKKATQKTFSDYSKIISTLNKLRKIDSYKIGEPIIHIELGLGSFQGFEKMKVENEFGQLETKFVTNIKIEEKTIYVDLNSIDKLSRPKKRNEEV